jgi:tetratricopeptide (TPR) repeat protein
MLATLLLGAGIIYFPALDSLFLLDDHQNLKDLAEIEARGLGFYLFGSNAGPGGRPLALLSFALQYQSWPADPFAFKLVNLFLHLGNGALIFYICLLLCPTFRLNRSASIVLALLVTTLWLLHPLQLSTVLYVVQRMTILATTFMLIGIVVYLIGRERYLEQGKPATPLLTLAGVWICMVLAIACKESGILLPLFILVLEFTLLTPPGAGLRWRQYLVPLLLLPLLLFTLYILRGGIEGVLASYSGKDFTLTERLLTEANVLLEYLRLAFIPTSGSLSLFNDDYTIARSLLNPPLTLFSVVMITLLVVSALVLRKRARIYAFAVLWFFAGHLLESSVINLELYFEHRNYLPLLGPLIFTIWGLGKLSERTVSVALRKGITPVYILVILAVTLMEVRLWSDPYLQAHEWARQHPQSKRAISHLLDLNLILGRNAEAGELMTRLQRLDERDIFPVIKDITIRSCYNGETLMATDWVQYNTAAAMAQYRNLGVISGIENLVYLHSNNRCGQLELARMLGFMDTLISNPEFEYVKGELHDNAATFAVFQGDLDKALAHLNTSLTIAPDIDRKIFKLRILTAKRELTQARLLLQDIRQQLQGMPRQLLFFSDILADTEQEMLAAAATGTGNNVNNGELRD